MFEIKPLMPCIISYNEEDTNTPLSNLSKSLVAYLHVRVLETILNKNNFNQYAQNFIVNIDDLDNILKIIKQYHLVTPHKIKSMEFIFNEDDYFLNLLVSSDIDMYFFKIKLTKNLFIDGARQLSQHLNQFYNSDEVIELESEKIIHKLSGEIMTITFSST